MRRTFLLLALARMCAAQISTFDGTWVMTSEGQAILKLTLATEHGHITGSLTKSSELTIDQDGDVTELSPEQVTLPVQRASLKPGRLHARVARHGHAPLAPGAALSDGNAVMLATKLPEPEYPPEIRALREQLRGMVKEDQEARFAFDEARMDSADAKDRPEVLRIFDRYGWVTISLAGKDAAHNYWLLVQHQTPEIQQRLLPALEKAARSGEASMSDYAYLYDRVQVGLGKPQPWGSQTKCVNGRPVLSPVDDPAGLDARRKELFMMPIREYMKMDYLVKACAKMGKMGK